MSKFVILGAAALAFASSGAMAATTVSFSPGSGALPAGTQVFQNFDSYSVGQALPGGTNAFAYDTTSANGAIPAYGSSGNYGSVLGGGSYTVNFGPTSVFAFVLGSLDTYNSLKLLYQGGGSDTYMGGQIINGLSFPTGDQSATGSNGVVSFNVNGGPKIVGAVFSSSQNSFEFDNLAAAVPEPATWALMILGFGAIGGMMRRRRVSVAYAA
ncbi:MAG: PEP-CTERM sorting domain-containing protein [Sphingomonas sp.]|uniref:PEPxxWA-CTERM sorting domain-containing protein n=2 Tax=unclassified Sphingomonas TaxID=196159 RepID=UPI001ACBC1C4|nr:PEPxxWA-CTERM sorting domain-containing protein [Sphingomonas sp.]MBN8849030.1 PEP-CTERM sorting domain-containing protein [Sphingomonas sp.]